MKNILNKSVALVSGALLLASCSGFLDENPKSTLTFQDYYKTEAQVTANVTYLYRSGAPTKFASVNAYEPSFAANNSILTGYFTNSYEGQELTNKYARLLTRQEQTQTVSGTVDGVWDDCYRAINAANGAIKSIPSIVENGKMSASAGANLDGQARFFRAFNYMMLVKAFGDVPLSVDFIVDLAQDTQLPRTDAAQVYALIESDLRTAADELPDASFADNGHRVTKWIAEMALTDILFYQGKYSEAAAEAKKIIGSGKFTLAANIDNEANSAYNQLRAIDDLPESIYAYEYNSALSTNGYTPCHAFSGSATTTFSTWVIFERVFGPTNRYLNVYGTNDLRVQPNQFFHWTYARPDDPSKTWSAPEFSTGYMEGFTNIDFAGMGYQYPGCWYFYDEDGLLNTGRGTKDWNIYRYAETLLDAAEAIAQSAGVDAEAAGYLAQVQSRALGESVADLTAANQALSKEDFIKACWTERLREFPFESKIWDDCVRTGKFPEISTTNRGEVEYVDLVGATNGSGAVIKTSDRYWPISLNEKQRNPNLTQNEGYKE